MSSIPTRERPPLIPLDITPQTPPPTYQTTHNFTIPDQTSPTSPIESPTSYFSPIHSSNRREVIMGGLVTPRRGCGLDTPGGGVIGDEEKGLERGLSIEVPGIVLTEPVPDLPPRSPSPPPKQILLLPPTSLPIPPYSTSYEQRFGPLIHQGRSSTLGLGGVTIRTMMLLLLLAVGGWHLWTVYGVGDDEMVGM